MTIVWITIKVLQGCGGNMGTRAYIHLIKTLEICMNKSPVMLPSITNTFCSELPAEYRQLGGSRL